MCRSGWLALCGAALIFAGGCSRTDSVVARVRKPAAAQNPVRSGRQAAPIDNLAINMGSDASQSSWYVPGTISALSDANLPGNVDASGLLHEPQTRALAKDPGTGAPAELSSVSTGDTTAVPLPASISTATLLLGASGAALVLHRFRRREPQGV